MKTKRLFVCWCIATVWALGVCEPPRAHAAPNGVYVAKTVTKKVYAHMMPWFEDPSTSGTGKWGIHW